MSVFVGTGLASFCLVVISHTSITSVPIVPVSGQFLLSQVIGQCLASGLGSGLFPYCASQYLVGAFLVSDVDVPSLPPLPFQPDIDSIIH